MKLNFRPSELAIDPMKHFILITGIEEDSDGPVGQKIENDESSSDSFVKTDDDLDFLKIRLRIKDKWQFNMNDALIESFIYLPDIDVYKER